MNFEIKYIYISIISITHWEKDAKNRASDVNEVGR